MAQPPRSKPTARRETAAEIERAAAAWVARADRGALSAADEAALARWAAADPRRAGAHARALALSFHLDRAVALGENFFVPPDEPRSSRWRQGVAAAASIALMAAGVGGLLVYRDTMATPASALIRTDAGNVRRVTLPDGSALTLNAKTQLRPEMTPGLRRVDLLQGEALFHVAKNPARPFVVVAGRLNVRAVGTSFSVRRIEEGAISVVVSEGVVDVSRDGAVLGRVHAGIAFTVDTRSIPTITPLSTAGLAGALAWADGRLDLHGMTLDEAARAFGRYSDLAIHIDDPAVGRLRVTGAYAATDPQGFAEAAALSLGLASERRHDGIHLHEK